MKPLMVLLAVQNGALPSDWRWRPPPKIKLVLSNDALGQITNYIVPLRCTLTCRIPLILVRIQVIHVTIHQIPRSLFLSVQTLMHRRLFLTIVVQPLVSYEPRLDRTLGSNIGIQYFLECPLNPFFSLCTCLLN